MTTSDRGVKERFRDKILDVETAIRLTYNEKDSDQMIQKMSDFIHQELQKARESERERIKALILRRTEIPKGAKNPTRDMVVVLGETLVDLIDAHSELDQPKPIEIPVKGTQIDCKEHGANQIVIKNGAGWCGECLKKSELDQHHA